MLNLGGLFFTLDADTRGLVNAQRRIERFAGDVRAAFRGVSRGTVDPGFANQLARQERAMVGMMERIKRVQQNLSNASLTPRGAREAQVVMERLGLAFENFTRKMSGSALNTLDFGRRVQHMSSQITDATRNLNRLKTEAGKGLDATPWRNFSNVLQGLGSASLVVQGHFGGFSTRFFGLTTLVRDFGATAAITAASIAGLSTGILLLGQNSLRAGMQMQQLQMQLTAVAGSTQAAGQHMRFIKDVADQAGLSFIDLGRGYARFLASAQAGGLTLSQTQAAFRGISLAAATMQLSAEDTQGVFRALDQMMSKGTVQAEELRGQLGDRLPGAFIIAAQAMGKTTRELNKMLKEGEVVASEFVPKFVNQLQLIYNIDPSKPIETLRASIGRLGNEWLYLGDQMAQATGILQTAQGLVDGLASTLRFLGENLNTVAGIVGAVTGAFIGLGVAMGVNAIIQYFVAWGSLTQGLAYAAIVVKDLIMGFIGLNAVMAANPIMRVISLLITLAATVGGAVLGYKLLSGALGDSNAAMDDSLSFMNRYIANQKEMGKQVRATTMDMMQQIRVMAATQLEKTREAYENLKDATTPMTIIPGMLTIKTSPEGIKKAADAAKKEAQRLQQIGRTMQGLGQVSKLPELAGAAQDLGGVEDAAKGASESVEGITNRIKDLMDASATAKAQFEALFAPLAAGESMQARIDGLQDLGDALRLVNNLSTKELNTAAGLLGVPANVDDVTIAVAGLIRETRTANEVVQEFVNIWKGLDEGEIRLRGLNRQLEAITAARSGVVDPGQMRYLENLTAAELEVQKLATSGEEGAKALETLRQRLAGMGFAGMSAAEGLALFNTQTEEAQERVRVLSSAADRMRSLREEVEGLMQASGAYGGTLGGGARNFAFGADIGEAVEQAVRRGQAALEFRRGLEAVGTAQDVVNAKTAQFLDLLQNLDSERQVFDRVREAAERNRAAMQSMVGDSLGTLKEFLTGVKDLGDAIEDLGMKLLDTAYQNFVVSPIQDMLARAGQGAGNKAASGIDQTIAQIMDLGGASSGVSQVMQTNLINSILGTVTGQVTQQTATNATTASMVQLAISAKAAAMALSAIVTMGGGDEEGGGGSGLIGALFKLGGSIFGAVSGAPNMGDIYPGIDPLFIPHGTSGPVTAGNAYRINEPGVMGEYFIPRVSGYMTPNHPGQSGGTTYIDASTTVDARGATIDAVAAIRRELAQRDAQLRAELPLAIDRRVMDSSSRLRY